MPLITQADNTLEYKPMSNESPSQIINLTQLGYISVTGSDATKFLHAQFTNDLQALKVSHWHYSGYCTPKGRLLAFMIVLKRGDNDHLLIMDNSVIDKFLPRLRMFVMRDDVSIENGTAELHGAIDGIPEDWRDVMGQPAETGTAVCRDQSCLLTIDKRRCLYINESGQTVNSSTSQQGWIRQDIVNGIPTVTAETQESFVPQMVNLDLIGAVDFKKGCYPGQEVVARVHYLGKIKQRMFYLSLETADDIAPGGQVFSTEQTDKAVGTVVSTASENGSAVLLAVLQTKAVIEGIPLRLGSVDGPEMTIHALPYSIPDLEDDSEDQAE